MFPFVMEQNDGVEGELKSSLSLPFFEETPIELFRSRLKSAILHVLEIGIAPEDNTTSFIAKRNFQSLEQTLIASIDWKDVCGSHNKHVTANNGLGRSLLQEFMNILQPDRSIQCIPLLPTAYFPAFGSFLVEGILSSGNQTVNMSCSGVILSRSSWEPAQQYLLDVLVEMARHIPSLQSKVVHIVRQKLEKVDVSMHETSCLNVLSIFLSITKEWIRQFPRTHFACLEVLVILANKLGGLRGHQINNQRHTEVAKASNDTEISPSCRKIQVKRQDKRIMDYFEGEMSDKEETNFLHQFSKKLNRYGPSRSSVNIRFQDVIQLQASTDVPGENKNKITRETLPRLESKCVRAILSLADSLISTYRESMAIRLLKVFLSARGFSGGPPHESIMRLCAMLFVHRTPLLNWSHVHGLLWAQVVRTEFSMRSLKVHAEWVVESVIFDEQNENALTGVMQQWIDLLRKIAESSDSPAFRKEKDYPVVRTWTYMVARRGGQMIKIESLWRSILSVSAQLSTVFDNPDSWIDWNWPTNQQRLMMETSQILGVLGFCRLTEAIHLNASKTVTKQVLKSTTSCPWFANEGGIRWLAIQLSPFLPTTHVIAHKQHFADAVRNASMKKVLKREAASRVAIMNFLSADIMQVVFSFLNFKRILHIRLVCKEWKEAADHQSIWRRLYEQRFGIVLASWRRETEVAVSPVPFDFLPCGVNWKRSFRDRVLVDRDIGFRANQAGWRIRQCMYFGCYKVLYSSSRMKKHYDMHERRPKAPQTILSSKKRKTAKVKKKREERKP